MTLFSKQSIIFSALFSTLILSGCGSSNSSKTTPPKVETPPVKVEPVKTDYQALIDSSVSEYLPGIILRIASPEQEFLGSAGLSNLSTFEALETHHQMPTASAGKPMISLLAAMLHEEGQLNLDDKLDHWLNAELVALIPYGDQITLRQLLNHTSGIYNYSDGGGEYADYLDEVFENPTVSRTDLDFLPFVINRPAYHAPGTGFKYSNAGYLLAGLILDQALGYHHSVELRSRIIDPLAMTSTYYKGIEKSQGEFVAGYVLHDSGDMLNAKPFHQDMTRASDPVVSTVEDMAVFLKSLIEDGTFVSDAVKDTIFGEDALVDEGTYQYGLGIHKKIINGKAAFFHNGLEYGFTSHNVYIPETKSSISALFNCGGYDECEMAVDTLMDKVFDNETK